ncbi:MAG: hypothetical protein JJU02_10470 [Cryomorphaceae bacterium]|nr:hypothetical protein [Cryomorphaceae bacterium]
MFVKPDHIEKLARHFPATTQEWRNSILENGRVFTSELGADIIREGDSAKCVFILSGLGLCISNEKATLVTPGKCIGLQETFSSVKTPSTISNDQNERKTQGNFLPFNCKIQTISNKLVYLVIEGDAVLKSVKKNPALQETWFYLLNQWFEDEMISGLTLFQKRTKDRIKEALNCIRIHADGHVNFPIKYLQALTGISRSSMYRCLREMQTTENRGLLFENGVVYL